MGARLARRAGRHDVELTGVAMYRFDQIFGTGRGLRDELLRTVATVQLPPTGRTTPNPTLPPGYVPPPANIPASGQPGVLQPWWAGPIVEMRVRNGTTPGPLQLSPGPTVRVGIPPLALEWHAMFTGGSLPAASSITSRLRVSRLDGRGALGVHRSAPGRVCERLSCTTRLRPPRRRPQATGSAPPSRASPETSRSDSGS